MAFDFNSITPGPAPAVTVVGPRPFTLLSAGDLLPHGVIGTSGSPGSNDEIGIEAGDGGGGAKTAGAIEDIPTLTEWGLIIMVMLLPALGAIMIQRRYSSVPAQDRLQLRDYRR